LPPHLVLYSFPTRRSSDLSPLFLVYLYTKKRVRSRLAGERENRRPPAHAPYRLWNPELVDPSQATSVASSEMAAHQPELRDVDRSEEHTSELQSRFDLVCR